ncbi:hypothetical protein [uncultured Maritimibacter sp.]|uniref:hypothetical protein n=1 Tax=uncultured Maritimibacter sp. TaxID=991866 RepID=UPI0026021001|nr:hypothetical protein [uncultured Maritimibacter sp.]
MKTNAFKTFATTEDGAVTVDWVVLTAAIVGLGTSVLISVSGGTTALAANVSSALSDMEVLPRGAFDVGKWGPLTNDSNFSSIVSATAGQSNDELRGWGQLAHDAAMNSGNSEQNRRNEGDIYAARYAELQKRGQDVSGMTDPRDVAAAVRADYE